MRKVALSFVVLVILFPLSARAATGITITASSKEIRLFRGSATNVILTIKNIELSKHNYIADISSKLGWIDTRNVSPTLILSGGESTTVSLPIAIPLAASLVAKEEISYSLVSQVDTNFSSSIILRVEPLSTPPVPSISGPDTGAANEEVVFTFHAVEEDSLAIDDAFTYEIDWEGDDVVNKITQEGGRNVTARFAYLKDGDYDLRLKVTNDSFGGSASVTHTILIGQSSETEEEDSSAIDFIESRLKQVGRTSVNRKVLQRSKDNPCGQFVGSLLTSCLMELRKTGGKEFAVDRTKPVSTIGRRQAALKARKKNARSAIISRIVPGNKTIDLTPKVQYTTRARLLTMPKVINSIPLIERRANPASRKTAVQQVCVRRVGISLINCLIESGIDITRKTVDNGTWDVWMKLQNR